MAKDKTPTKPARPDSNCTRCKLSSKSQVICQPAVGPRASDIMLVSEALGSTKDSFSKDPGSKLDYCLERAGLNRSDLRLVNRVRCSTGKAPSKAQLDACEPFTLYDILTTQPKVIVTLGSAVAKSLIEGWVHKFHRPDGTSSNKTNKLDAFRGFPTKQTFMYVSPRRIFKHTCWVIPALAPAALLRDANATQDQLLTWDLWLAGQYAQGNEVLTMPDTKVHIADTMPKVDKLFRNMVRQGTVVHDLETTGLEAHQHDIVCAGFGWKAGEAWVLPWLDQCEMGKPSKHFWSRQDQERIIRDFRQVLGKVKLIGQGIKFDLKFLRHLTGFTDFEVAFDTQVGSHVLDENTPNNLTFQAQQRLHWDRYETPIEHFKKDKQCDLSHAPQWSVWNYQGFDIDATKQIADQQIQELKQQGLVRCYKTEAGLTVPVADLEYVGVRADRVMLLKLSQQYRKQQDDCKAWLHKKAAQYIPHMAETFNPNADKQIAELLIAAGAELTKKTATGQIAVDKFVRANLALKKNPAGRIAAKVSELKSTVKYISTYLDGKDGDGGVLQFIQPVTVDGVTTDRICATYNQTKTVTGRLTAERWVTFPRQGGVRTIIVPDDDDSDIISVDYAKAELCVMCWLANDIRMIQELTNGVDLHSHMAVTIKLNRMPTDAEYARMLPDIEKNERALAKQVIFGVGYGRQAPSIVEAFPHLFPDKMKKWDRIKKVDGIIDAFWKKYPDIYNHMQDQILQAKRTGKLRTALVGRYRRFDHARAWFRSSHSKGCQFRDKDIQKMERQAMNFDVQSTASDELSKATLRVYNAIKQANIPGLRIMLSIHDQLMFNCKRDYIPDAIPLIKEAMQSMLPKGNGRLYEVPLSVDPELMSRWGVGIDGKVQY